MDPNEREGWTNIVTPDDLDEHMAAIEQAETNARLVAEMFSDFPLGEGSRLLVPGCGTGQMFDYITPAQIGNVKFTFTDLNPSFLEKLKGRISGQEYLVDDIEDTKLRGNYDGVLAVLLLQHIEWKRGIDSMLGFNPKGLYIIIQEQGCGGHALTRVADVPESISKFAEKANPSLVPRKELTDYLGKKGYAPLKVYERCVPGDKKMVGFVFSQLNTANS